MLNGPSTIVLDRLGRISGLSVATPLCDRRRTEAHDQHERQNITQQWLQREYTRLHMACRTHDILHEGTAAASTTTSGPMVSLIDSRLSLPIDSKQAEKGTQRTQLFFGPRRRPPRRGLSSLPK